MNVYSGKKQEIRELIMRSKPIVSFAISCYGSGRSKGLCYSNVRPNEFRRLGLMRKAKCCKTCSFVELDYHARLYCSFRQEGVSCESICDDYTGDDE